MTLATYLQEQAESIKTPTAQDFKNNKFLPIHFVFSFKMILHLTSGLQIC